MDRTEAVVVGVKAESPTSETHALPDLSMRMFVDLMLPCVSLKVLPEV